MEPSETSPDGTTIDSLKDDNIEGILLRLPSPASLARAALASSPPFLRRFRDLHPWSPVLGLFVSHSDLEQLPIFHPAASVRSDPDLAATVRRSDFLLTRLEHDPAWRFRDCRNGRLLLCRGDSLSVYDPVSHRHVAVPRPRSDEPLLPVSVAPDYISDCLLDGHGKEGAAACFRVVTVQRDGQRLRAMEYDSCTAGWRIHPWVDGIDVPTQSMRPMHAAAAGLIFWRYDRNSSLLLDTGTMAFSIVALPVLAPLSNLLPRPPRVYAIGDTEAGVCCLLLIVGTTMLQVWLLKKNDDGGHTWEFEKQSNIDCLASFNRRFSVHVVAAGVAVVYSASAKFSHFVIDLKDLSLKDKFRCHRSMAFPFQMPWPPAALVPTSRCERSTLQTYAFRDAENQHEAPSSSRKRKSNDEMASGEETMEPSITIASWQNESSEKKFCFHIGPPS